MKTIIETLQDLLRRINAIERLTNDDYEITIDDKRLLTEALNQALHLHSVSGSASSSVTHKKEGYYSAMGKVNCKSDCPKGGLCPREIKSTPEGDLSVENHFLCAWVQKFIVDNEGRVVLEKNKNKK